MSWLGIWCPVIWHPNAHNVPSEFSFIACSPGYVCQVSKDQWPKLDMTVSGCKKLSTHYKGCSGISVAVSVYDIDDYLPEGWENLAITRL